MPRGNLPGGQRSVPLHWVLEILVIQILLVLLTEWRNYRLLLILLRFHSPLCFDPYRSQNLSPALIRFPLVEGEGHRRLFSGQDEPLYLGDCPPRKTLFQRKKHWGLGATATAEIWAE